MKMRVVVMSKEGEYLTTYENVALLYTSYEGDRFILVKHRNPEEIKETPDDRYETYAVSTDSVNLIVTMM